jgi:CelD/BcsL family acetyltransferase involved in cellulose biosynthesis
VNFHGSDWIVRLVLLQEIPDDAELSAQWNALVQRLPQTQVFYTYEWALAVHRAYSKTLQPLLYLAYDEADLLLGVVALARDSQEIVSFLCATTGDYCDFLSLAEHKMEFVLAVLADLRTQGLEKITLTNLPADSGTMAALEAAAKRNGYHCFARPAYECAQVVLARLERRPGEKRPMLPRKKMLRRFLNAMSRQTPVRLDHARSWDAIETILPEFIHAHVARFLLTGRISNMARPERRAFLQELAKLLAPSGGIALTRMMTDHAFAWNYGFQFHGTWFWYQPTFDTDLEKYSPGFCLLAKLIEEASEDPAMKIVDLGLGAEEYKERFANQTRPTLYVTLHASVAQHIREIVRYHAANAVKTAPVLEAAVRASAKRLDELRVKARTSGTGAALADLMKRFSAALVSKTEVFFFEGCGVSSVNARDAKLQPIDLALLTSAVMQYVDDQATLDYLIRAAARLREGKSEGFALLDADGALQHFAWVSDFDGFFLSELNGNVKAPSPDSVMLFDCWTPASMRGRCHYGQAISLIAMRMLDRGRKPWIFSAANNVASVRGIEKAGFQRRYSLVRRRVLGWQTISGEAPRTSVVHAEEVSARV